MQFKAFEITSKIRHIHVTNLFFFQILGVKLKVVKLNGEAARVAHSDLLFITSTVRQDGTKLQHVLVKVQSRLWPLTSAQQQDSLTALGDPDWDTLFVEFLEINERKSMFNGIYKVKQFGNGVYCLQNLWKLVKNTRNKNRLHEICNNYLTMHKAIQWLQNSITNTTILLVTISIPYHRF